MKLKNPQGHKKITVEQNQSLEIFLEDVDTGSREFTLEVQLAGDRAACRIVGRAQAKGDDQKIWHISQYYQGRQQLGRIDLRGTAEEKSFLQFDGVACLESSSEEGNAEVSEKIILFDEAKGKSLPVLTVKTDKVAAASHGATVAPLSSQLLLYLQSRGIPKKSAQDMLKQGFLKL